VSNALVKQQNIRTLSFRDMGISESRSLWTTPPKRKKYTFPKPDTEHAGDKVEFVKRQIW